MDLSPVSWAEGAWTTPPAAVAEDGTDLLVTCVEGSDAWRTTSYGFIHDTEHALVAPLPSDSAMEVVFTADYAEQFDQAGIFVVAAQDRWIKAGVEFADGHPQLGAVVTGPVSDWSVARADDLAGRRVRVRVSRAGDAITVRAAVDGGPLQLVRVAPFPADAEAAAGPLACAPTRAGLTVRFHGWWRGPADGSLH
ncbi:DUF1349 domain-containing protein [Tessaracoccus defluvii]|uniref:DUF1349 domain-containing protein n=1 Tax=Tessaracoccus defluvii TaxID=1285901 RepID=A0A7H0H7W6_9ACTN|nr:DUF1349 domain-containing protein [Tessaracoccus defluvii]QNP56632.1 DUF1349 domain-containing protein [Tessaracoccus defluvii]